MSGGTSLTSGHSRSFLSVPLRCPSDNHGVSLYGVEGEVWGLRWEGGCELHSDWMILLDTSMNEKLELGLSKYSIQSLEALELLILID